MGSANKMKGFEVLQIVHLSTHVVTGCFIAVLSTWSMNEANKVQLKRITLNDIRLKRYSIKYHSYINFKIGLELRIYQ